jgi:hypothetical protein
MPRRRPIRCQDGPKGCVGQRVSEARGAKGPHACIVIFLIDFRPEAPEPCSVVRQSCSPALFWSRVSSNLPLIKVRFRMSRNRFAQTSRERIPFLRQRGIRTGCLTTNLGPGSHLNVFCSPFLVVTSISLHGTVRTIGSRGPPVRRWISRSWMRNAVFNVVFASDSWSPAIVSSPIAMHAKQAGSCAAGSAS